MSELEMDVDVRRFKAYPAYKDSGVEWLGEVPVGWDILRLKHLTVEPPQYGANEPAQHVDPDQPRYIRITDIDDAGRLRSDTFCSLPENIAKPYLLKQGDILFARSGATVGKTLFYEESWGRACYAGYLIRFRINHLFTSAQFIYYFTQSSSYRNWLTSSFIQSTIQNISADKYANLALAVPSLAEQQSIVEFLDGETSKIDALITKKERLIELLKEKRSAVISHAVTKGLDPDVEMKDSGLEWLENIPRHWQVWKLKQISSIKGRIGFRGYTSADQVDEGNGALTLGATQISSDGHIDLSNPTYLSWEKYYESPEIMTHRGDILIVQRGSTCGKAGIISGDIGPATINPSLVLLRSTETDSRFLFYILSSIYIQSMLKCLLSSTAIPMLSQNQIGNLSACLPGNEEIAQIVNYVDLETRRLDRLIAKVTAAIEKLREYRTALIAAAVTGKIDVREEANTA